MIATPRLVLEPISVKHALACFHDFQDHSLYSYVPQAAPATVAELEERYAFLEQAKAPAGEVWLNWFGKSISTKRYVCFVQATVFLEKSTALIAYQTFLPFRRRGFATEACLAVIQHILEEYSINLVVAEIDFRNEPSIRLVKSMGFLQRSFKPNADFFKGMPSDEVEMVLDLRMKAPL